MAAAMSDASDNFLRIFDELKRITSLLADSKSKREGCRSLLNLLETINEIPAAFHAPIKDLLVSEGYFPYLDQIDVLDFRSELQKEFHRSDALPNFVLHREQLIVSDILATKESIILSAPTSFGKSLLIEEVIARKQYNNIVLIEPTLALIDEMRTKLKKYENYYKLVFSKNQKPESKNIFLLTQERLVDFEDLPHIDFFVIDEFYKLTLDNDDRADTLNIAFYKLLKKTKSFYLLGPPIDQVPRAFLTKYECIFKTTDFETVNVSLINAGKRTSTNLYKLLISLNEQTLIYCKGPGYCETLARNFVDKNELEDTNENDDVVEWINDNIHTEWTLKRLLKKRVAFHHGGLPRHISRHIVDAFNKGKIDYLFCTTTLIEGVNTTAKNVVVYDEKKGNKELSKFDLRNIAGRAGRMSEFLTGNVYMFVPEPSSDTNFVDIPWYSQENVRDALLVQIEEPDLKPESKKRVESLLANPYLDKDIIKKNTSIDPAGQILLAQLLRADPQLNKQLSWTGIPTWPQLEKVCELIWDNLITRRDNAIDGVVSSRQLATIVSRYNRMRSPAVMISDHVKNRPNDSVDKAVSTVMRWIRKWFEFRMPKMLMTLHNIQETVYTDMKLPIGNYKFFSTQLENGFLPPAVASLREMGIPIELGRKLIDKLEISVDAELDDLIKRIRNELDVSEFSAYEQQLLSRI